MTLRSHDRHLELDWPGVLRLAGRFASTERGHEAILALEPSGDPDEVERRLGITRDLVARRGVSAPIALGGLDEAAPLLPRLGPVGLAFPPEDLLDLFALLERSEGARQAVPLPDLPLPHLEALLAPLPELAHVLTEREVIFERDGRIKDTATARLAAIRSSITRLRRDVVKRLEELARTYPDALSDAYVTEKQGRYCLPVRSDRRDAVAGIVHTKSGSGQTFFVEPLAVVDANNALAEALEQEREEVHRILVATTARFSAVKADLVAVVAVLTELDSYQARAELSQRVGGTFVERGGGLVIRGARHPLLDRRLAPLREEVFGEDSEARHSEAVPLDLELPEGRRLLLLSGPNAGGKSVAMKTVGLLALLNQSGFALPCDPGTRLPVFDRILVVAGDAQDLLGDLSSFAAQMTRTARVIAQATPRSLVLLDELGSGTDPDEGASLAIAILEHDLRRGGLAVGTTHLSAVKEWAHGQPDVLAAAMEFDEEAGRPTFRVRPGATGRSRAIAVAEKAGLPDRVLAAARGLLGDRWAVADAALERLERETAAARREAEAARLLVSELEVRSSLLEREKEALSAERSRLREKARAEVERALESLRERTRRELDRLREEQKAGRAISRGALTTITQAAREDAVQILAEEEAVRKGPVAVGDLVRIQPFRTVGRLLSLDPARGEAEVEVSGKRMRVASGALEHAAGEVRPKPRPAPTAPEPAPGPAAKVPPSSELILIGQRVDEALREVERAVNDAMVAGRGAIRIVHGYGTGRLGAAVKEFLSEHPGVASHRPGDAQEGGNAVTIAQLDV